MPLENINNAYLPPDAKMQPPQAFVDVFYAQTNSASLGATLSFGACHMSYADTTDWLKGRITMVFLFDPALVTVDFSSNDLDQDSIDRIIQSVWDFAHDGHTAFADGVLALDGGTNSSPGSGGLANIADLTGWGWAITHN